MSIFLLALCLTPGWAHWSQVFPQELQKDSSIEAPARPKAEVKKEKSRPIYFKRESFSVPSLAPQRSISSEQDQQTLDKDTLRGFELNDGVSAHQEDSRVPSSEKNSAIQVPEKASWSVSGALSFVSRQYEITDQTGQKGTITSNPGLGLLLQGSYEMKGQTLYLEGFYQREDFKPDEQTTVVQDTDKQMNFKVLLGDHIGRKRWGYGVGLGTVVGFFSESATLLRSEHFLRPEFYGFYEDEIWKSESTIYRLRLQVLYGLGAENANYRIHQSFAGQASLEREQKLSKELSTFWRLDYSHQQDDPDNYEQLVQGLGFHLGLRWGY